MYPTRISSPAQSSEAWVHDRIDAPRPSRRGLVVGTSLSLLMHVLLFIAMPKYGLNEGMTSQKALGPLVVHLNHAPPPQQAEAVVPPPVVAAAPVPPPLAKPPAMRRRAPVIAVTKPTQELPVPVEQSAQPSPPQQPTSPPAMDFLAMLNAKRRASEEGAVRANAEALAASREPNADEIATANINRNLQSSSRGRDGTNGIFQILSKGTRTATFSFRGWTTDPNNNWRQVIDVDAGLHGDVELAIVRRMIELIRTHYQGDFNWESHRLGRVVRLSAREEDNATLEAFLAREFFSGS